MTAMSMSQRKRRRPTWFDVPPIEVNTRIATFLSAREHTQSTLSFALLSPCTSRAVATALDYKLVIDTTTHLQAEAWRLVFADSLRQLTVSPALPFNEAYLRLIRAPRIHTLSIPPHPEYFDALKNSHQLRNLSITFVESVLASRGLPQLVNVLPTLRITKLSLLSEASYVPTLFQNLFTAFHNDPPLLHLGKHCPHVESLHIGVKLWSLRQILPVLQRFDKLRHLSLSGIINLCDQVDESLIHFLRQLDTVELSEVAYAPRLCVQIGGTVETLQHGFMDWCDLKALSVCHNLKTLDIDVHHGQEADLRHLTKQLASLRLRWHHDPQHGFYEPEKGTLLDLISEAPKLIDYHLNDVEVSLRELSSIMQTLGVRLKSFGFPLPTKGQSAVRALKVLATTGAQHNPGLEELYPYSTDKMFSVRDWSWRPRPASEEDKEGLVRMLDQLHQHAPMLKAGILDRVGAVLTTPENGVRRSLSVPSLAIV